MIRSVMSQCVYTFRHINHIKSCDINNIIILFLKLNLLNPFFVFLFNILIYIGIIATKKLISD